MNTTFQNVTEAVVRIPAEYRYREKSEFTLLIESGYFEFHDQIGENEIIEVLKIQPDLITDWIGLSEDKRTSEGWYIIREDKSFFVGYWPPGNDKIEIKTPDKFSACAAFIKRHIESIRIGFKK